MSTQWLSKKPLTELSNQELCDELDRYETEFWKIASNRVDQRGGALAKGPAQSPSPNDGKGRALK